MDIKKELDAKVYELTKREDQFGKSITESMIYRKIITDIYDMVEKRKKNYINGLKHPDTDIDVCNAYINDQKEILQNIESIIQEVKK
jgi:hypothetical protein